jgi:hypothetical protein
MIVWNDKCDDWDKEEMQMTFGIGCSVETIYYINCLIIFFSKHLVLDVK